MYRTKPSICFPSRRTWTGSNGTSFLLQIPTGELFLPWSDETELLCLYDDNKDDDVGVKDDVDDNDDDDGRSQVWVHAQQRQNVEEEHGGFCNHDDNLKLFSNYFFSKSNTNSNMNFWLKFPFQVANPGSTCIGVDLNRNFPEG